MLSVQPQPVGVSAPAAVKRASSEDMSRSKWLRQEPSLDTSIRTSSSYDDEEERQPEDEEMVEMELGQQAQSEESEAGGVEEESMTKQRSVTFAPAPVVVPPVGKGIGATFFSRACSRSLFIALITFTAAIALAAVLAHLERHIVSSAPWVVSYTETLPDTIHARNHSHPPTHPLFHQPLVFSTLFSTQTYKHMLTFLSTPHPHQKNRALPSSPSSPPSS